MAKRNVVEITLPHGLTVKADRLDSRTIKTVKPGDYVPAWLDVRGSICHFYARVTGVEGLVVSTEFGSENRAHVISSSKGDSFTVYRPI